ncbi:MAG: ornithine cyclodeaminase family protein [Anaerolineae bacterium]|nr:ornithine cyclodeaminase family protein [Anaerolineae bacterium]
MPTIILNQSQVKQLLNPVDVLDQLRDAFQAYSRERTIPAGRFPVQLPGPGSGMLLAPGLVTGIPAYSVKVHAKFPDQKPAIRGVLLLHNLATGELLAIMDSAYITAVRTGLAAALATDVLARHEAETIAIIGAGVQGQYQLRYLSLLRELQHVTVFDTSAQNAATFQDSMSTELELPITTCADVGEAVRDADIILTATWATEPFLTLDMLKPGVHITTLGADQPGKCEISREVIEAALFVCDDRDLTVQMGVLAGLGLDANAIDAELGDVLAHVHPGRTQDSQITVYGSVGLAFQDLVTGWHIYQAARQAHMGLDVDFLDAV